MKKVILLLLGVSFNTFAQNVRKVPIPYTPTIKPISAKDKALILSKKSVNTNAVFTNSAGGFSGSTPTPSPEVAQANHLQDIPVNKYTGTPIVKIPIHTLSEAGLNVPITLNYNASGVRGHAVAGWTGLGWDLEGIPMLNRIVRGIPDEGKLDAFDGLKGYYYYGYQVLSTPLSDTDNDKEPDAFYLWAGGTSYRFMFDSHQVPHFSPEADIKVDVSSINNPYENGSNHYARVFTLFKFTMPDGTQYHFTNQNTEETAEVEVKIARNNGIYPTGSAFGDFLKNSMAVSAWYLSKIVSPYGHEINFEYNRVAYTYYKVADNESNLDCPTTVVKKLNKVYIRGCQISTIKSRNIKIDFNTGFKSCTTQINPITGLPENICTFSGTPRYDIDSWGNNPTNQSDAKKLINIQISDNVANPTQALTYSFEYDYFTGNDNSGYDLPPNTPAYTYSEVGLTHKKRLKLTRVTIPDGNHYDFTYLGESANFNFKTRFTYGIDHWGYINGADGNISLTGLIGRDDAVSCPSSSNRASDINYMLYGALLKVSSSMGSETTLDYEANRAKNYNNGASDIGGLRIKKLTTKDLIRNTETTKEYSYLNSTLSTGFLFVKPIYRFNDIYENLYCNSSVYDLLLTESSRPTVGYSQVSETVFDSNNTLQVGKNISYFDQNETELSTYRTDVQCIDGNGDNYTCNIYQIEEFAPAYDYRCGSLLKEENYNQNNQLLNSNETQYLRSAFYSAVSRRIVKLNDKTFISTYYNLFATYTPRNTTSKVYSQDGTGIPQTTFVEYTYKDQMPQIYQDKYKGKHNQLVKTSTTDSYGYTVQNFNKYVADFNFDEDSTLICEPDCLPLCSEGCTYWDVTEHIPTNGTEARAIYELQQKGMSAVPIETFSTRNGKTISAGYQTYYPENGTYPTLPQLSYSLRTIPKTSFEEVVYQKAVAPMTNDAMNKDSGYGTAKSEVLGYNPIGLPTEIQVKRGATGKIIYDGQNILPINTIRNFGVADALTTTNEYTDKFRGVSKQIMPNNVELRYEYYSSDSRLKNIKDKDGNILKKYEYDFSGVLSLSSLSWDDTRRVKLCSGGQITLSVYVNGLVSGATAQFSTDGGSTWNNANIGSDGYTFTITPTNGYQSFKARASDNQSVEITTQYHASCSTSPPFDWSTNSCTNVSGTCNFFVSVTGLAVDSFAEFSINNVDWFRANVGNNGYNVSVPYGGGGVQGFNVRASEDHSVTKNGTLTKCQ